MSKTTNKRAIIVGVFITLGLLIFILGVFTLGGQQNAFVKAVEITAVFDDVSGLQQGNNVWFSGVKIGTVKKVVFTGKSQVKVMMNIEERARQFIRKDAKAKISSDGLIGNKIIVIYEGTPAAGEVEKGDNLLVEKAMSTEDMLATLQENNQNLVAITNDFKVISNHLVAGKGTVGALLKDDALYNSLEKTMTNLQTAAGNSQRITAGIADYTAKLQAPGSLSSGLVNDTVIIKNLQAAVSQLNSAAVSANGFTENLRIMSSDLNNKNNAVGVLLRDEETAETMRSMLKNLDNSSEKLDENLEALQHNFLLRGFFRRKARQEKKDSLQ